MKHSEILVGNEYALRLPVEGVSEDLWPLTRATVVSAASLQATYEVTVATYRPTNVDDFLREHLVEAIIEGWVTYEPSVRHVTAHIGDFVRPWGSVPAYVWAVSLSKPPKATRRRRRAAQLAKAAS